MKCPKCSYISFDTPARCRNCGYDLTAVAGAPVPVDGPLRDGGAGDGPMPDFALRNTPEGVAPPDRSRVGAIDLPLFDAPVPGLDDSPLISAPSPPRAPLAVRRATPDPSRLPKPGRQRPSRHGAPAIAAPPRPGPAPTPLPAPPGPPRPPPPPPRAPPPPPPPPPRGGGGGRPLDPGALDGPRLLDPGLEDAGAGATAPGGHDGAVRPHAPAPAPVPAEAARPLPRLTALVADVALLGAINLAVVHSTLSIVRYPWSRLGELPALPLVTFCAMLDAGYFVLLTGASGQTLGKMLAGIRVVGADGGRVPMTQAALRAALAPLSLVTFGLGYLPALLGQDRRTLHDRLSSTRVVRA